MLFDKSLKKTEQVKHLEHGELPFGWINSHKTFIQPIESQNRYFLNNWLESRNKAPKEYYAALKSFILFLQDTKKLCDSKGECYSKWFNDIIADKDYINNRINELNQIQLNFNQLNESHKFKQSLTSESILLVIKQNEGILQTELYKHFDSILQSDLSEKIYRLATEGKIKREKNGRTYSLYSVTHKVTH